MYILGLNAYHGDASAALVADGKLVAAIEEERLNRIKHWAGLPVLAAQACLASGDVDDLRHVAVSRNPRAHFWRKLVRAAAHTGGWRRLASRAENSIHVVRLAHSLDRLGVADLNRITVHHVEHHRAHLASAFFASPFDEAAVVSIDGFGDFTSMMWGIGRGHHISALGSVGFPHSLGLFYTAFTQYLGFPKYGDEYKMMGLAAYGEPRFLPQVRELIHITCDQIRLNLDYFTHHRSGVEMTWKAGEPVTGPVYSPKLTEVFGPAPGSGIDQRHADIAASVQAAFEECYFALLNYIHRRTGLRKLCLAGGAALNCVANGKILEQTPFRELYIQPAANDAGTSIGAALHVWHQVLGHPRSFVMRHVYFGPEYSDGQIRNELDGAGAIYDRLDEDALVDQTANALAAGKIAGWFQGRMEFGPRALGNRSILADPRRIEMKDILNRRIKHRETFRPFCPSVLAEAAGDYFTTRQPSPFMVEAHHVQPNQRSRIPAVAHADGTCRLQTVERETNPRFWKLLRRFGEITGVPVLINTSFNENEPIVNTPREALDCFQRTNMDVLAIGSFLAYKSGQHRHSGLCVAEACG